MVRIEYPLIFSSALPENETILTLIRARTGLSISQDDGVFFHPILRTKVEIMRYVDLGELAISLFSGKKAYLPMAMIAVLEDLGGRLQIDFRPPHWYGMSFDELKWWYFVPK